MASVLLRARPSDDSTPVAADRRGGRAPVFATVLRDGLLQLLHTEEVGRLGLASSGCVHAIDRSIQHNQLTNHPPDRSTNTYITHTITTHTASAMPS
jgi:hypothetical protein